MNIIIDTNVLVSGIFFESGPPDKIIKALISNKFDLAISPEVLTEYIETITELRVDYPQINVDNLGEDIPEIAYVCGRQVVPARLPGPKRRHVSRLRYYKQNKNYYQRRQGPAQCFRVQRH